MRLLVTVVCPASRQSTDVVLEADPATPMTVVAGELERFASSAGPLYVDGQRVWRRLTLAEAPIRDGSVISLGSPDGCVVPAPSGLVDILVAGGPDAGVIHRVGPGRADIGSGAAAVIRIGDPAVPGRALLVDVDDEGGCRVAAYPGAAATLDRTQLGAPVPWRAGQQVAVGGTLLGLAPCAAADAALSPSADGGGLDFRRAPRALPSPLPLPLPLPFAAPVGPGWADGQGWSKDGPGSVDRRPLPVLTAGLPLVVGLTLAFLLHHVYLLALAGLSPVLLIGGALTERGGGRADGQPAGPAAGDADRRGRIEGDARAALDAEQAARREQCPDPATALGIAAGPRGRLWERRRADPDYLLLRIGTADLPVTVEVAGSGREPPGRFPSGREPSRRRRTVVRSVPDALVTVPLAECGVLGVAGPGDSARAVGRWLAASAALLHSPNELRIYLLTDASGRAGWEWVRWLPHCRPGPGGSCVAQLGNDAESVAARVDELLAIVAARQRVIRDGYQGVGCGPGIVVVLDGSRRLRSLPGVGPLLGRLLGEGPQAGVYAICLDDGERLLPSECQTVAVVGRDGLRVQATMADTVRGVAADRVDPGWCARVARSLAPIRDVGDDVHGRPAAGAGGERPVPAASAARPASSAARDSPASTAPAPATRVWVASVEWPALGWPAPAAAPLAGPMPAG